MHHIRQPVRASGVRNREGVIRVETELNGNEAVVVVRLKAVEVDRLRAAVVLVLIRVERHAAGSNDGNLAQVAAGCELDAVCDAIGCDESFVAGLVRGGAAIFGREIFVGALDLNVEVALRRGAVGRVSRRRSGAGRCDTIARW